MDVFMGMQDEKIPQLGELLAILHASMAAYNHGITEAKFYDLYDEYIEDGHNMFDLIPIILEYNSWQKPPVLLFYWLIFIFWYYSAIL